MRCGFRVLVRLNGSGVVWNGKLRVFIDFEVVITIIIGVQC